MTALCTHQIHAEVAQLTRLDACGLPVTGSGNRSVIEGWLSVDVEPDRQPGDPFNLRDGSGIVRVAGVDPAQNTSDAVTIELCTLDPEAIALLDAAAVAITVTGAPNPTGGPIVVTGTPAVGATFSSREDLGPVAIELWSALEGSTACEGAPCYNRWLLARVVNLRRQGSTWEDNVFRLSLRGNLLGNPSWGNGVNGEYPRAIGADEPVVYDRVCDPPPTSTCGTIAVTGAPGLFPGLGNVKVSGEAATQMRRLQTAARTRLVQAVTVGDSVGFGTFADSPWRTGYIGLTTAALQTRWGDGGCGVRSLYYSTNGYGGDELPRTGGWFFGDSGAPQYGAAALAGATMNIPLLRGTHGRIHYQSWPTGANITGRLGYTLDGGAQVVTQTKQQFRDRVINFEIGAAGNHTVVVTAIDIIVLNGIEAFNDTGFVNHNCSRGNKTSGSVLAKSIPQEGGFYPELIMTATARQWTPDILFYTLAGADAIASTNLTTHYDNIVKAFQIVKAINPDCVIFGLAEHMANIQDTHPGGKVGVQQYVANLERATYEFGGVFVDFWAEGNNDLAWMQARGFMNADNLHPNQAGHNWMAGILTRAINSAIG